MSTPILQVSGLSFAYPERELFSDLSLNIPSGVTLVQGGDGRGKTTLLQLLAGRMQAQAGRLELKGIDLHTEGEAYRRQIFCMELRSEAYDQMNVPEYFASVHAAFPGFDASRLPALIEGLSLTPHVEKKLFMLSTGSKRKVWLAAAFAAGATLNLLDDPFAGLDQASINFVVKTLNAAALNPQQAWVIALYEPPQGVPLAQTLDLGD
ncbi:ATP-binding cassette domain-containing protein [Herbaspirillum lusitanum]|uniref:ATP-binding cassette domain-containing protein n=1 Tax=Herbaspirillum lusitanum TaxID=213312 RepID=A0ABW9AHA0_9BURK